MKLVSKRVWQLSAVLGGVLLVGAVTPRALHAVAATMVLVTNTMGNPVITVPVNAAASQQIMLRTPFGAEVSPGDSVNLVQLNYSTGLQAHSTFVVPAGQSLVVTAVDLQVSGSNTESLGLDPTLPGDPLRSRSGQRRWVAGCRCCGEQLQSSTTAVELPP